MVSCIGRRRVHNSYLLVWFCITQKLDSIVLEGIRTILHISTAIRFKTKHNYYILDTTNSRAIENIINYFKGNLIGMKNPEYKI